jgi:hypothetical protein
MHRIHIISTVVVLLGLASFALADAPRRGTARVVPAACSSTGMACPASCGPCPQGCPLPCANGASASAVTEAATF